MIRSHFALMIGLFAFVRCPVEFAGHQRGGTPGGAGTRSARKRCSAA
jgi:hypothetical protein